MYKWLRRILVFVFISLVLIFGILTGLVYGYQNVVSDAIIKKLNEHFSKQLTFQKANLSFLSRFPNLTLHLQNVKIKSNENSQNTPFIQVQNFYIDVSWKDFFGKQYNVSQIELSDGQVSMIVSDDSKDNYKDIFKLIPEKSEVKDVVFNLSKVRLQNINFIYQHSSQEEKIGFTIKKASLDKNSQNKLSLFSTVQCEIQNFIVELQKKEVISFEKISFKDKIRYDLAEKKITFNNNLLKIRETEYLVNGLYTLDEKAGNDIDLLLTSVEKNLKSVLVFLPKVYYDRLIDYKVIGNLEFEAAIKGIWNKKSFPHLNIDFYGKNLSIRSPNIQQKLEELSFEGNISNGAKSNSATTRLSIQAIQAKFNNQKIMADLLVSNIYEPYLSIQLQGGFDMESLQAFYPMDNIGKMEGLLGIEINLEGYYNQLSSANTAGFLELKNASFQFKNRPILFSKVNTFLTLEDNKATIKESNGFLGNSDFKAKGYLESLLATIINPNNTIRFDGSVNCQKLFLEELVSLKKEKEVFQYDLFLPSNFKAYCMLKADSLLFRNLKARNLKADIGLQDKVLKSSNLSFQVAGGSISFLGQLNSQINDHHKVDGRLYFQQMDFPYFLYVFEFFGQSIFLGRNITGTSDGTIELALTLNNQLKTNFSNAVADASISVKNGKFKDFEPMARLVNILKTKKINLESNLGFNDMRANLQIRNESLFIPEMEIQTPTQNLYIIGRSQLDQHFDYRVKAPLEKAATITVILPKEKPKTDKKPEKEAPEKIIVKPAYYINLQGNLLDFKANFMESANLEQLETNWLREKRGLLTLFEKSPIERKVFNTDTLKTAFWKF